MAKILLVEDDRTLLAALQFNLEKDGHDVIAVTDGRDALTSAREAPPDLVILDLLLPGMHGFDVCRALRKDSTVPILMLSAKTEEVDRIVGLELGADDYVTKPFGMQELIARVRAHLRRAYQAPRSEPEQVLIDGDLEVDLVRHEVTKANRPVALKPKEFELLAFLMQRPGWTFTREQLLQHVWGYEAFGRTRTVDVHISELRGKIEDDPDRPVRIVTVRGTGYRFAS